MANQERKLAAGSQGARPSKEIIRVTLRLHGPELKRVRELREMLSLNSEVDATRYLMQRGLEAVTPWLIVGQAQTKKAQRENLTPDQLDSLLMPLPPTVDLQGLFDALGRRLEKMRKST